MKRLTWYGVAQSPYNDFLLEELRKQFDLVVFYQVGEMKSHPWQMKPPKYKFHITPKSLIKAIRRLFTSDIVWVSGWSYWVHVIIMLLPFQRSKFVYWTDTPNLDPKLWSGLKGFFRTILVKLVFRRFDQVWSTGKPGCHALAQLGCDTRKIRSLPFFHDLSRIANGHNRILNEKKSAGQIAFLVMGRIVAWKRFDDAIRALHSVNVGNTVLWIAGTGPQEHELRRLALSLGLNDRVKFLGWLQPSEVEQAIVACDVFVHPSEFDPFPTVVLDAMSWSKPIIGSDKAGSVIDRVEHGQNGYIFKSGDISAIADHMKFFVEHENLIVDFGKKAREKAVEYPVELAFVRFNELMNLN